MYPFPFPVAVRIEAVEPTESEGGAVEAVSRLRRLPPVCVLMTLGSAMLGRLRFRRQLIGRRVMMEDGRRFRIFRHLSLRSRGADPPDLAAVLLVRFRFGRLSERSNRLLSLLPVPVIAGSPGFRQKLWMTDDRGWWQGVYEWDSRQAIEAYRASPVFRTMERRAASGTLSVTVIESCRLSDWLRPDS